MAVNRHCGVDVDWRQFCDNPCIESGGLKIPIKNKRAADCEVCRWERMTAKSSVKAQSVD